MERWKHTRGQTERKEGLIDPFAQSPMQALNVYIPRTVYNVDTWCAVCFKATCIVTKGFQMNSLICEKLSVNIGCGWRRSEGNFIRAHTVHFCYVVSLGLRAAFVFGVPIVGSALCFDLAPGESCLSKMERLAQHFSVLQRTIIAFFILAETIILLK